MMADITVTVEKKGARFTMADDLALLLEVTAYDRPFKTKSKAWPLIKKTMKEALPKFAESSERTFRERCVNLVKAHIKGTNTSLKQ